MFTLIICNFYGQFFAILLEKQIGDFYKDLSLSLEINGRNIPSRAARGRTLLRRNKIVEELTKNFGKDIDERVGFRQQSPHAKSSQFRAISSYKM